MTRKIVALLLFLTFVSAIAFSDVIAETEATWIEGYVKFVSTSATIQTCGIFFDGSRPIVVTTSPGYITTLTANSKFWGAFGIDMSNSAGKNCLALVMLAKACDWKIRIQLNAGVVINNTNMILYAQAPYSE